MKVPSIAKGLAVAMGFGAAAAVSAQVLLAPGDAPGNINGNLASGPAGWLAYNSSPATPDDAGNFTAQVDSAVTAGNANGPTALNFWYKLTNVPQPGAAPLISLGMPMPAGATVLVNQQVGPPAPGGNLATLAFNTGSSVSMFWTANPLFSGQPSTWVVVETPFTAYALLTVGAVDGTTEDVEALVPLIPEPTTYVGLFALGLAGFAAYRRFRA